MPTFSIIIPVYKAEKYIQHCINSILSQTFSDFEILCVDDCGGDDSIKIVENIAKTDNRIKIFYHKSNKGVSAARNLALSKATGKYVFCVDADDWIRETTLEILLNIFDKYNVESVWFDGYRYYENTKKFEEKPMHRRRAGFIDLTPPILPTYSDMCGMKVYTLDSIKRINLKWPEDVNFDEDGEFYFKYYMHYPLVYSINSTLYFYRKHGNSLSDGYARGSFGIIDTYKVIEHLKDYYKKYNVYDAYKITILKLLQNRISLALKYSILQQNKISSLELLNNLNFPEDYQEFEKDLTPLVTVVVPFYNVEKYIAECLDSIISQTYKNLEILCIDDCGQDNSVDIVKQYMKKDERIKLIKHRKNKGLGGARNTGLKKANGKYIFFVDSDDWITNDCVDVAVKKLNETGLNSVWFKADYWMEETQEKLPITFCTHYMNLASCYMVVHDYNLGNFPVMTWNKAYRTDFLKKEKLSWKENVIFEDVEFYWRMFIKSPQVYIIDKHMYFYRQREDSIMNTNASSKEEKFAQAVDVLLDVYKYLTSENIFERYKSSFFKYVNDIFYMFDKVIEDQNVLKQSKLEILQKIHQLL